MLANKKVLVIIIFSAITMIGCSDLSKENTIKLVDNNQEYFKKNVELQFGVYNEISPLYNFLLFNEMSNDIEEKTSLQTKLNLRKSYSEFNKLLEEKKLDIAYIYLDDSKLKDYQKLFDIYFSPVFQAPPTTLIIVKDKEIQDFSHLRNKIFSYTEPNSIISFTVDDYIEKEGLNKETYFKNYFYTFFVDEALSALHSNIVQAISIDSLNFSILEYLDDINGFHQTSGIRILKQFDSGPQPVILIRKDLDNVIKNKIIEYFRQFPIDQEQIRISGLLQINSFEENINDGLK